MTVAFRLVLSALFASALSSHAFAEEVSPESELVSEEGWYIVDGEGFTVEFPTKPKIEKKSGSVSYSSLDSSKFPVVMYFFSVTIPEGPVDAEKLVTERLENLSTHPLNVLDQEVKDSGNGIILDTLCADLNTRVLRCDRMLVTKDRVYTFTTLFFPNSAENHEYFVGSFIPAAG